MTTQTPRSFYFQSMGLTLHALAWGDPTKPLIIAHHGFLDHAHSWHWIAQALSQDWYVVAPDARGHGDSDWIGAGGDYAFAPYLADLHALIRHIDKDTAIVMGHSMGASVVAYYAGIYPTNIRGVITLEGLGPPDNPIDNTPKHLAKYVRHMEHGYRNRKMSRMLSLEDAMSRLIKTDSRLSLIEARRLALSSTRQEGDGIIWKFDPLHRAAMSTPFTLEKAITLWRAIDVPMLNIRGADSPYRSDDHHKRTAAVNDLREVVIDNAGHNLHTHAYTAVIAAIMPFLETLSE